MLCKSCSACGKIFIFFGELENSVIDEHIQAFHIASHDTTYAIDRNIDIESLISNFDLGSFYFNPYEKINPYEKPRIVKLKLPIIKFYCKNKTSYNIQEAVLYPNNECDGSVVTCVYILSRFGISKAIIRKLIFDQNLINSDDFIKGGSIGFNDDEFRIDFGVTDNKSKWKIFQSDVKLKIGSKYNIYYRPYERPWLIHRYVFVKQNYY